MSILPLFPELERKEVWGGVGREQESGSDPVFKSVF